MDIRYISRQQAPGLEHEAPKGVLTALQKAVLAMSCQIRYLGLLHRWTKRVPGHTLAPTTKDEAHIIRSLRVVPADGRTVTPPSRSDYDLNERPAASKPLTPAAVLVPLIARGSQWSMLLTQRTAHLRDHAGQVSFPGGRLEPSDDGPVAGALRETQEEVGLGSEHIRIAGLLDEYETSTGFAVTPVVGFVSPGFTLELDAFEVADAFEVPLAFLLDERNHQRQSAMRHGVKRHYYVFEYGDRYIWGATAGMIMNLYERLASPD